MSKKPYAKLTLAHKETKQRVEVFSVWPGNFPGAYSVSFSPDEPDAEYPSITLTTMLKWLVTGKLSQYYVNYTIEQEREERRGWQRKPAPAASHVDDFGDDDIPF